LTEEEEEELAVVAVPGNVEHARSHHVALQQDYHDLLCLCGLGGRRCPFSAEKNDNF
jgi:hypothetical protein